MQFRKPIYTLQSILKIRFHLWRTLSVSIFLLFHFVSFCQINTNDTLQILLTDTLKQIEKKDSTTLNQTKNKNKSNELIIEGSIIDQENFEPLSFATIHFINTGIGIRSDFEGYFQFQLKSIPGDSISVSVIGYKTKKIKIDKSLSYQKYNIALERNEIQIKDIVVKFDRNPALSLVKKVIKNKPLNDINYQKNYAYEVYKKVEIDVNKLPKNTFKKIPILNKVNFVEKYIDSSSEEPPFLPVLLSESIADYYYQSSPPKSKETLKGTRVSGIDNSSVAGIMTSMYLNIHFYNNSVPIFNIDFVSPIANDAPFFYKYKITDTIKTDEQLYYQVSFAPKRSGERTFQGYFWVHDSDYALKKIEVYATKEQNINWVNKIHIIHEYNKTDNYFWNIEKEKIYIDFHPPHGSKFAGIIGKKTSSYKKLAVNKDSIENILNSRKENNNSYADENTLHSDDLFWNQVRHDSLNKNESNVYKMIDTIQNMPLYKFYRDFLYFLGTGMIDFGPIKIGTLYSLYSKNNIEGNRYRFSISTTPKLFKNLLLNGYIAYGTFDKKIKYKANALWIWNRYPRKHISIEFKRDLSSTISQFNESGSFDNILNTIARKNFIPYKLNFENKKRIEILNSYYFGFSNLFSFEQKNIIPYFPLPSSTIFIDKNGNPTQELHSTEIGLETRYAPKERFISGNFTRRTLNEKELIAKLYLGAGLKNIFHSNYEYYKIKFILSDQIKFNRAGSIFSKVFLGKTFGHLPYPLLDIMPGNEYYSYNKNVFSLMQRYEYIADTYIGCFLEHSLGSLFFKYIPVVKKAHIRTFWNAKGVYGTLSKANQKLNLNKGYPFQYFSNMPYLELGTGLENILDILRIDFVWRILPYSKPNYNLQSNNFGVLASMKFSF